MTVNGVPQHSRLGAALPGSKQRLIWPPAPQTSCYASAWRALAAGRSSARCFAAANGSTGCFGTPQRWVVQACWLAVFPSLLNSGTQPCNGGAKAGDLSVWRWTRHCQTLLVCTRHLQRKQTASERPTVLRRRVRASGGSILSTYIVTHRTKRWMAERSVNWIGLVPMPPDSPVSNCPVLCVGFPLRKHTCGTSHLPEQGVMNGDMPFL